MAPTRSAISDEQGRQLVVALDGDGRPMERGDRPFRVGEGHERVERTDLRAGRHRRLQDLRPERTARVDHRLAAVHADAGRQRRDHVVGHGEDDQLDLLDEGLRLGERARPLDEAREAFPAAGVAAGDGVDRPAGPAQGEPERRPDRTRAHDPGVWRLAGYGMVMRMHVIALVRLVAVAMVPIRDGVEIDAGRLDRRFRLGAFAGRALAGKVAPRLHRSVFRRARYACTHRV